MAGRTPDDHVTFGEFAVLVTELRELYRRQRSVSSIHLSTMFYLSCRRPNSSGIDKGGGQLAHAPSPQLSRQDISIRLTL